MQGIKLEASYRSVHNIYSNCSSGHKAYIKLQLMAQIPHQVAAQDSYPIAYYSSAHNSYSSLHLQGMIPTANVHRSKQTRTCSRVSC